MVQVVPCMWYVLFRAHIPCCPDKGNAVSISQFCKLSLSLYKRKLSLYKPRLSLYKLNLNLNFVPTPNTKLAL